MLGLGNILTKGGAIQKFPNKYSFNFDGSNDDLILPSSVAPTGNFTVSAWVYSTGQGTNADNAFYYGAALQVFLAINTTGNYVQTYIAGAGGGAVTANSTITQNQWHHIAVTWDGSNTKIYIDGDNKSITGNGAGNPAAVTSHIGGKPGASVNQFKGYIDEVAVWHTNLDAPTISKIASKPRDLTKYSASNLKVWLRAGDKVQPESTTSIARADYSASFSGTDDKITIADDSSLDITGSWTCSAWIKVGSGTSGYDRIVGKQHTNSSCNYGIGLQNGIEFGAFLNNGSGGGFSAVYDSDNLVVGQWHHVAGVWDTEKLYAYVDGQLKATSADLSSTNSALANDGELLIGVNQSNGAEYFKGDISSVSVHKTRLPENDIAIMSKSRFRPTRDYMLKQVDFDGINDTINISHSSDYKPTTAITVSSWYKPTDHSNWGKIICVPYALSGWSIPYFSYALSSTDSTSGKPAFGGAFTNSGTYGTVTATTVMDLNEWYHIVGTYDGTSLKIYVNGVLENTSSRTGDIYYPVDANIQIGGRGEYSSGEFTEGCMVSVAVYSDAKDADFIYAQYAKGLFGDWSADTNLSGYWKMGNGTGDVYPTIVDQSSNSNNGTITNGTSDDIVENMVAGYDLGSFRGSEELGGELLGDPSFTVDNTDNITGTGTHANVTGGALVFVDPESPATGQTDIIFKNSGEQILVSGRVYKHIFTIADAGGSGARLKFDWITGHDHANYTDGTHTIYGLADQVSADMDISSSSPSFKMTDMSIKEVLSSAVDDTKNGVIDVSNPVLGTEVNTLANALSPTNETDATTGLTSDGTISSVSSPTTSSNYSIKLVTTENGDGISASSNFTVEIGKLYKFSITWKTESNDHSMKHLIGTTAGATNYLNLEGVSGSTEWVTSDYYFVTTHNILNFKFAEFTGDSDIVMYIDNISIKKVQGNAGKPTSMDATNFPYTSVLPDQSFLTGNSSSYNYFEGDSADEFIDCGTGLGSLLGDSYSGKLSVSIWFNQDQTNNTEGFFYIGSHSNSNGVWALYMANTLGTFRLRQNSSPSQEVDISSFTSTYTGWVNVLATWDGATTTAKLYVNGSLVATDTSMASSINFDAEKTIIGSYYNSSFTINGKVSGTGVWTVDQGDNALAIYNLGRHGNLLNKYSDNLIGFYDIGALDAETGIKNSHTRILDRSGNAFHGSVTSGASSDVVTAPNAEPEGYDIESTTRTTTIP